MKDVPLSSVKMERRWNFFLLMFGTWIKCLVWYAAARNLAAVEQPQLWNIWNFEQHTVHYKYIMFNTIGLKINVATILCVI